MCEVSLTVSCLLLYSIALDRNRMVLALVLPIIRMLLAPLARAFPAGFAIMRIARDLPPAVLRATL